jgi:hypothetical protein
LNKLYLHIGHDKTGSSYLQSLFAANVNDLRARQIHYPQDESTDQALKGMITEGNGSLLARSLALSNPSKATFQRPSGESLCFSSEQFFSFLVEDRFPSERPFWAAERRALPPAHRVSLLLGWAAENGFGEIRILLLIRNPVSHAVSQFQQMVKRAGSVLPMEEALFRYDTPAKVEHCIERLHDAPSVSLEVRNYSNVSERLDEVATDWLELPPGTLKPATLGVVNRSMTRGELSFIQFLNEIVGGEEFGLSDALCNLLPDVRIERDFPSLMTQRTLWGRNAASIERINAGLPAAHRYEFDEKAPPPSSANFDFSADQLRIIAHYLGERIRNLKSDFRTMETAHLDRIEALKSKVANLNRDLAAAKAKRQELEQKKKDIQIELQEVKKQSRF